MECLRKQNKILTNELYQTKKQLYQSNVKSSYLDVLIQQVPIIIWAIDKNGVITQSRGKGLESLGLEENQLVGQSVFTVYQDFPKTLQTIRSALNGNLTHSINKLDGKQLVHSDEIKIREVYYENIYFPSRDENGDIIGLNGISYEITTVKIAEKHVLEMKNRYQTLIDFSPLGMLVVQNHLCQYANDAFAEMFGYDSSEELIGMSSLEFAAPSVQNRIKQRSESRAMGLDEPLFYETLGKKKDGGVFPIHVSAKLINFSNEESILLFFQDLTEVKKLAKEKNKLQKQLIISQKLESLGVVAGGIAHDFNNLLVGILGNASLLETRFQNDTNVLPIIEDILNVSQEAANLTKQLLVYTGKTTIDREPCNLSKVIQEMIKLVQISISKSVLIDYQLENKIANIEADISQIKQIILNLVINASESIGDETGQIIIKTGMEYLDKEKAESFSPRFHPEQGDFSYVEISDTGIGINYHDIHKIFDPFFTTKFTGRGLGLSVVQGIVQAHNGAISVVSEPGKNTIFKVYFPISKKSRCKMEKKKSQIVSTTVGTVLFCDDNDQVRVVGGKMLKSIGFEPILASNGKEAVELFMEHEQDIILIILDLSMPIMNGKETVRAIRQISQNVPIVISSGYDKIDVLEKLQGEQKVDFLHKPYSLSKLREVTQIALNSLTIK